MPKVKTLIEKTETVMARNIRKELLNAKQEKKLTYEEIADRAYLSAPTANYAVKDPDSVKVSTLLRVCAVLGVELCIT